MRAKKILGICCKHLTNSASWSQVLCPPRMASVKDQTEGNQRCQFIQWSKRQANSHLLEWQSCRIKENWYWAYHQQNHWRWIGDGHGTCETPTWSHEWKINFPLCLPFLVRTVLHVLSGTTGRFLSLMFITASDLYRYVSDCYRTSASHPTTLRRILNFSSHTRWSFEKCSSSFMGVYSCL